LQHAAEKAAELELLAPASKSGENEKVSQILARVREQSPELAQAIDTVLSRFGAQIVGNQVFESSQAGIFHAITRMIQDFLGVTVPILGTVRASRRVRESVNLRKPMMLGLKDEDTRAFVQMAEALLAEDVAIDDLLADDPTREGGDDKFEHTPVTAPKIRPTPASLTATEGGVPAPAQPRQSGSAMLDPYMRRSPRVEVDWMGSLRGPDGIRPVRIFEVSDGGAIVETAQSLELGQELTLVFEQIPMQPQTRVKVIRRAANGFVVEGEIPPAVTAAAAPGPGARRSAG
jgi:hypothetical protein